MSSVAGSVVSGSMVQVDEAQMRGHVDEVVRRSVEERAWPRPLSYMAYPREHWTRIRTNNLLERIMREIRRELAWSVPSRTARAR